MNVKGALLPRHNHLSMVSVVCIGRLKLSGSTVEAVLTLAVRWQLEQVVDACCSFLGDHLRPSNCLTVLRLAGDNGCSGLKSLAGFYIAVGYLLLLQRYGGVERLYIQVYRLHQSSYKGLVV